MKTESGLEYKEIKAGKGPQAEGGKVVSVHYEGKFPDGKVFDSSYERGQPIEFELGRGQVIKGWDEGIALMKAGGIAQLIIPPELGYGERGAGGVIPPNATLVFDVELVAVK
jgi:FKBP-type peptidyl-prolyl cis-trans isomerase